MHFGLSPTAVQCTIQRPVCAGLLRGRGPASTLGMAEIQRKLSHVGRRSVRHEKRRHVDDPPHRRRRRQQVNRLRGAEQNRPDGDAAARRRLQQVVRDVRRVDIRQDQQIRVAFERRFRQHFLAQPRIRKRLGWASS